MEQLLFSNCKTRLTKLVSSWKLKKNNWIVSQQKNRFLTFKSKSLFLFVSFFTLNCIQLPPPPRPPYTYIPSNLSLAFTHMQFGASCFKIWLSRRNSFDSQEKYSEDLNNGYFINGTIQIPTFIWLLKWGFG